jgi:hypothetical protein
MAYRFNSGRGGVTCDKCNLLIDQDLSYAEYNELYDKSKNPKDFCMSCKIKINKTKNNKAQNKKKDLKKS